MLTLALLIKRNFKIFANVLLLLGCSKCLKKFKRKDNKNDYSGFEEDKWQQRSSEEHKYFARETLSAATPTLKNEMESSHDVRYSELHRLLYFNPISMHVVDLMHCLFLGIGKCVFVT